MPVAKRRQSRARSRVPTAGTRAFLVLIIGSALAPAGAQTTVSVTAGLDYNRGDYGGDSTTHVWTAPLRLEARRHPWSARLTLSEVWIRGDARLLGRGLAIADPSQQLSRRTEHGLGDVELSVARSFETPLRLGAGSPLYADSRVTLKLPTANEDKGLGSGRADIALQADLYAQVQSFLPFATVGHRWRGSRPDLQLEHGWFAFSGVDYKATEELRLGGFLSWSEAASRRSSDALELVPYASLVLGKRWQLIGYGRAGLEQGSPDAGAGLLLKYQIELAGERPPILMR